MEITEQAWDHQNVECAQVWHLVWSVLHHVGICTYKLQYTLHTLALDKWSVWGPLPKDKVCCWRHTVKLWKLTFLGVEVLETLETNVPQAIVIKFETALSLGEILVALLKDIMRDANWLRSRQSRRQSVLQWCGWITGFEMLLGCGRKVLRSCKKGQMCAHADVGMNCHGACALSRTVFWSSDLKLHEIGITGIGMFHLNFMALHVILRDSDRSCILTVGT